MAEKRSKEVENCIEFFNEGIKKGIDRAKLIKEIEDTTIRITYLNFLIYITTII